MTEQEAAKEEATEKDLVPFIARQIAGVRFDGPVPEYRELVEAAYHSLREVKAQRDAARALVIDAIGDVTRWRQRALQCVIDWTETRGE